MWTIVSVLFVFCAQYKQLGISGTMRSIVAAEGVGGLYRGILPALLSMAPNGAVFYGVYDCLKMAALRARHRQRGFSDGGTGDSTEPLEVWRMLLHGALAGAASEASTYPLDLVRRRLQVRLFLLLNSRARGRAVYLRFTAILAMLILPPEGGRNWLRLACSQAEQGSLNAQYERRRQRNVHRRVNRYLQSPSCVG